MSLLPRRSPAARAERLTHLLKHPCTIHDQFCRCPDCKPAAWRREIGPADRYALVCMLVITAATCVTVLH